MADGVGIVLREPIKWPCQPKLSLEWSSEQIGGWLQRMFPQDKPMQLSHETICRSLFMQTLGVLKKELMRHLRSQQRMRRPQCATTKGQPRGQITDGVSIGERPAAVNERGIPGHWEGDLITGLNNTHIATPLERQSGLTMLVKVLEKDTTNVITALIRQVENCPQSFVGC